MLDPLKFDGKKNRDLAPPPRAKFLHFRPTREPTLQERMDEVVYPMAEVVKPALNPSLAQAELEREQSRGDFAWGSDRIAHELATKLDQFVRRPEDAVRKLLSAVGTEHRFEGKSRNAIAVTPKNLSGLCNRFGLACNDGQARRRCFRHTHTHMQHTRARAAPLLPTPPPHARHCHLLLAPLSSRTRLPIAVRPSLVPHAPLRGGRRNRSSSATGCRATGAACRRCPPTCSTLRSTPRSSRARRGGVRSAARTRAARASASPRARARPESAR